MRRALFNVPIAVALGMAACTAPGLAGFTSYDAPPTASTTTAAGSTSLAPAPTTSDSTGPTSSSGEPGSTSSSESSDGSSGAAEPEAPPTIVEHALGPNPLEHPGAVAATIETAHAEGVRMQVDEGAPIELGLADPDTFTGEIPFYSALDNGDHSAKFVAWHDTRESAPLVIPFTLALPEPGSELYWGSDDAIGKGTVVALAVTPNHELIELGTHYPMGQPRCYLRRRDLAGAYFLIEGSVVDLAPDTMCSATGLVVDANGAIHVLVNKLIDGESRWWLGKLDAWGAPLASLGTGVPGATAQALASEGTRVAVCGSQPIGDDSDATAWIFTPGQPGKVLSFDYVPKGKLPHSIIETPHDCAFSTTHLVLTGAAWGAHDIGNDLRDRHFILEIDVAAGEPKWVVAEPVTGMQSVGHTIAIDSQNRYMTGGHRCDDKCDPIPEIRLFLPGWGQLWQYSLQAGVASPGDMVWSPADYFVLASAEEQGPNDTSFNVQARVAMHAVPLWSYDRHGAPDLQSAFALAIGPYNQVYAGGTGAGGYPAIAIIAP